MHNLCEYSFDELYEIASGISSKKDQAGHGSPFLSFSTVFNNYFVPDVLPDCMESSTIEQSTYSIQSGDIFLTRTSELVDELAISCVAIKDYPSATYSGFLKRLRPTQDNVTYPKFMAFYLRSPHFRKTMKNNSVMTLRASFNEAMFSYLKLLLPDYDDQVKIGDFLYLLEAKMSNNTRTCFELESIAKTIYNYWFIQYEYPTPLKYAVDFGDSTLCDRPYKSSGGKMVYNDDLKREIPFGWSVDSLYGIARYYNGLPLQKYRPTGEDYIPVIKIKEMSEGITPKSEKASPDIPSEAIISDGDFLFSWSASLEIKIWSGGKGALNQHIFKVTSDKYPQTFYYFELVNYLKHLKMLAEKRKTTMGHITLEHLKQAKICLPPIDILEKAHNIIKPLLEQHLALSKQNLQLANLRDWLIPVFMNGQIRFH